MDLRTQAPDTTQLSASSAERVRREHPIPLVIAMFYVGLATTFNFFDIDVGGYSFSFLVTLCLGALGWRELTGAPVFRRYLVIGGPLAFAVILSSVSAWSVDTLLASAGFVAWLAALPGLGALFRFERLRNATLTGLAIGASYLAIRILIRLLATGEALDANGSDVFGLDRNGVASVLLLLLPFIATGRRWTWPRVAVGLLILFEISALKSRATLVGALLAVFVLFLSQPGRRSFARTTYAGVSLLLVALMVPSLFGVTGGVIERFDELTDKQEEPEEELRRLATKKAVQVAIANPAFGVGYGNLEGTYAPAADEAKWGWNRRRIIEQFAYNTFAEAFAVFGIPGGLLYALLLLSMIASGLRRDVRTRAGPAVAALVGLSFWSYFQSTLGSNLIFFTIALTIGAVAAGSGAADGRADPVVPRDE